MNILFLGGDKRYKYMMNDLCDEEKVSQVGFDIMRDNITKETPESLNLSKYDIVLLPISGISDNMEIKSEIGTLKLDKDIFNNINKETLFFTGLKTKKITELIPNEQVISFLDDKEVESTNNSLTVDGTIDDIRDRKNDTICILGYGHLGKELYLRLKRSRNKSICYF